MTVLTKVEGDIMLTLYIRMHRYSVLCNITGKYIQHLAFDQTTQVQCLAVLNLSGRTWTHTCSLSFLSVGNIALPNKENC